MIGRKLLVLSLSSAALAACGGTARSRHPSLTQAPPLELDRVVLYRNGVGYFERTGKIAGDVLTLKVRKDQVNDLLKSLTIVERSSGRAVSVSMPLDPQTWANAAIATLRPGQGSLAEVLDALRGSEVTVKTTDGTVHGRVAMVERIENGGGDDDGNDVPRVDHRLTLLDGDVLRVVLLSTIRGLRLEDGDLAMQFNRTLDASAGEGMFQQVEVSIRLAGASSHDLMVSYVVAAPMWKPTYRVVLPKEPQGKALLQAWAVVDNTSGEEWHDVKLALTSGAPIAFRYDLHSPRDVARPDLTDRGVHRQADAMVGETTYLPPPPPPVVAAAPMPPMAPRAEPRPAKKMPAASRSAGGAPRANDDVEVDGWYDKNAETESDNGVDDESAGVDFDALARSTQAQARAATVAGQTRFELQERVTVPEGTSTMVAIINAKVEGEEIFLYRPGGAGSGYEQNPYRVVRFKNSTPFVLEPGPIGIYAGGSFVGEGLSETIGADTRATIPFSVETGLLVSSVSNSDQDQMRLVKMSRGVLEVERFSRLTTTYTVKALAMADGFTLMLRHPKAGWNYSLDKRPDGTEDLPDGYLIRLVVPKDAREGSISITEQTPSRTTLSIWNAPALDVLEKLLISAEIGPDVRARLQPIIDRRRALAKLEEQLQGVTERRNQLDQRSEELRQNLRAIAKNPKAGPQREKWTKQLDEFTSEGNKLGAQLADLEAKRLDQRVELEDALQSFELIMPAPKPIATPKP